MEPAYWFPGTEFLYLRTAGYQRKDNATINNQRLTTVFIMTPENFITLGRQALELTMLIAAPPLLAALIIGLVVSIFQAATQINEMTLSFIPKLLALGLSLALFGGWQLTMMVDYTRDIYKRIPAMFS